MDEEIVYEILFAVEEIPEGRVASYGQIARLIGREKNSRLVGKVLSRAELYGDYPCHRVVNHAGRLAPHFPEQRERLEREGVAFRSNGCVDMKNTAGTAEKVPEDIPERPACLCDRQGASRIRGMADCHKTQRKN